jgi:antitoxin ParD1/3/4
VPTRNINLTDHYDQFVQDEIAIGRYKNASEVLRAGLRLLEQQARENEEKLALLRGLTADGLASLDRGQGVLLEGDRQLADFIGKIGRRAAERVADSTGGK